MLTYFIADILSIMIAVIAYSFTFAEFHIPRKRFMYLFFGFVLIIAISDFIEFFYYPSNSMIIDVIYLLMTMAQVFLLPKLILRIPMKSIFIFSCMQYIITIVLSGLYAIASAILVPEIENIYFSSGIFDEFSFSYLAICVFMKVLSYGISYVIYTKYISKRVLSLWIPLMMPIIIICLVILLFERDGDYAYTGTREFTIPILIGILISVGIISFFYLKQLKRIKMQYHTKFQRESRMKQKYAMLNEYHTLMKEQEAIKKKRHDLKNHMKTLEILIQQGETKVVDTYIEQLLQDFNLEK